jgi:dCTP diphosphatase
MTTPDPDSERLPTTGPATLADLVAAVCRFRDDRDWSQFHTPKNLAAAIAIEAAELQERFLWKTDAEVDQGLADAATRAGVAEEIADVVMFTMLLADRLGIDLAEAIATKLAANERKYPVALARGNARKYTDLRAAALEADHIDSDKKS